MLDEQQLPGPEQTPQIAINHQALPRSFLHVSIPQSCLHCHHKWTVNLILILFFYCSNSQFMQVRANKHNNREQRTETKYEICSFNQSFPPPSFLASAGCSESHLFLIISANDASGAIIQMLTKKLINKERR